MEAKEKIGFHLSLNTNNLERSLRFYEKFLGAAPAKLKPGYAKFVTQDPEFHLALSQVSQTQRGTGTLSHLGFRLTDVQEVRAKRDLLTAAGIEIAADESEATCCYAKQTKFWVTDPDGNRWEIYTVHADVEEGDASTLAQEPEQGVACCG